MTTLDSLETVAISLSVLLPLVVTYILLRRAQKRFQTGEGDVISVIVIATCFIISLISTGYIILLIKNLTIVEEDFFGFFKILSGHTFFSYIALPIFYFLTNSTLRFIAWLISSEL